jgi:hypothetical protein
MSSRIEHIVCEPSACAELAGGGQTYDPAALTIQQRDDLLFHSRWECSRANSRDSASRLPIALTVTRNASSVASGSKRASALCESHHSKTSGTHLSAPLTLRPEAIAGVELVEIRFTGFACARVIGVTRAARCVVISGALAA